MTIANTNAGWVNSDGLRVKFPAEEVVKGIGGEYNQLTSLHLSEYDLVYTDIALGTSDTTVWIVDYDSIFPAGTVVEYIEFVVGTPFNSAGDAFTMNVGLVAASDFTTINDADGYVADIPETVLDTAQTVYRVVIAESNVGTTTYAGTLMDTVMPVDGVLCVNWSGAVPTAGTMKMRVAWRPAIGI